MVFGDADALTTGARQLLGPDRRRRKYCATGTALCSATAVSQGGKPASGLPLPPRRQRHLRQGLPPDGPAFTSADGSKVVKLSGFRASPSNSVCQRIRRFCRVRSPQSWQWATINERPAITDPPSDNAGSRVLFND